MRANVGVNIYDKENIENKIKNTGNRKIENNIWKSGNIKYKVYRYLFPLLVYMILICAATSYKAVHAAGESRSNIPGNQTSYKSELEYDVSTGYYLETIVTTSTYYDTVSGCNVTSVETVHNYYNYDGYTYELVMSQKNTDTNYTPAEPMATPEVPVFQTPAPADNPDNINNVPAIQGRPYDDNYIEPEQIDFDSSPLEVTVKRKSKKKAVISWKTNNTAHGYYIFRSASEDGKYKKVGEVDDYSIDTYTDKKLKTGKIYYYRVQSYYKTRTDILTSEKSEAVQVSTIKTQQLVNKLKKLKKQYPDGKYWNHVGYKVSAGQSTYGFVTKSPCRHEGTPNGVASTCNKYSVMLNGKVMTGYQCYGFANLLGDKLFGKAPIKVHKSYKKSKVGDHVRYGGHSVVIIEKHSKYVKVAECNIGGTCKIKWGRKISSRALKNATYYTRY
ncbi:MAG: fibronectin type III domain-containing protein [Lachnospiraceae bacterium]|nr:fibronectin type III domain-containing protein [Lachnospiraceae bacterium]MCX4384099.1 fibronectin type III domain-containing protein [Parabacteroides distasonis]